MTRRTFALLLGAVAVATVAPWALPQPAATAAGCADIAVVFARGTAEPPGLGWTGQSFTEAVRARAGGRTVQASPVDYPASSDFGDTRAFAHTVLGGIRDAQQQLIALAATCPATRIVLGGYSQGAALAGFTTIAGVPDGVSEADAGYLPPPLPADIAGHVAAVVLFGGPSDRWMNDVGAPAVRVGPAYESKTLELCVAGDTICDGAPAGPPNGLHVLYAVNGMTLEAADYALARV
ncbi:cutinase family protein [Nocardia thailandica]|uniref:cutinase family protein n=1 Tax=Nocardia thailandica TaxID=257275 RepID=UPI0002F33DD5|nr:cutinase family protein [Nocardia thailandica]